MFAKEHIMTAYYYPWSKGKAECCFDMIKRTIRKSIKEVTSKIAAWKDKKISMDNIEGISKLVKMDWLELLRERSRDHQTHRKNIVLRK